MKRFKLLSLFAAALLWLGGQSANAFTLTCLSGSNYGANEGCQKLFDGTENTKWGTWDGYDGKTVHTIFKAVLPIAPASYELVIANDTNGSPGRNWKKWKIYGGNFASDSEATKDAEGWAVIDEKDTELPTGQFEVVSLNLSAPDGNYYSYFKIVVEELRGGWGEYCQMDEFRFVDFKIDTSIAQSYLDFDYETGTDADLVSAYSEKRGTLETAIATNDPDQIVPAVEALAPIYNKINTLRSGNFIALYWTSTWGDGSGSNLVDKNEDTKWGGDFKGAEGSAEYVQYMAFRGKAQQPYFYKLVTGGDTEAYNGRNWKSWKIFGGNFASEAEAARDAEGWVLLDERTDISEKYLPMKNKYPATFDFNKGVAEAYRFFKVEVTAAHSGKAIQMSEMYLCTEEEFDAIRQPLVDEFKDFDTTAEVQAEYADEMARFIELYEELKTTADAVRLTEVYNEMKELRTVLERSMRYVELTKVLTVVDGVFQLGTAADLMNFSAAVNDGATSLNAALTADIDLTGEEFVPIGNTSNYFSGSFDGKGHSVTLKIDSDQSCQALFGGATDGASFSNMIIKGSVKGNGSTAALIGEAKGNHGSITISSVGIEADVTSTGNYNGAFLGNDWGATVTLHVSNSYNTGTVTSEGENCSLMGGYFAGNANTFTNVYNTGTVSKGSNKFCYGNAGTFTNCYTTTTTDGDKAGLTKGIATAMVASGELCYKLGAAFTQDLSQEGHPTFGSKVVSAGKWFNDDADDVYYNLEDGNYTVYQLNLDEGNAKYEVPANVTAKHVTMARSLKAGVWNTFCSPVALGGDNFSAVKELTGVTADGENYTMTFSDAAGDIVPGKPYMVQVAEAKTELAATDADVATAEIPVTYDGLTFQGVFSGGTAPMGSFIISDNVFYNVNSTVSLKAFRGYITVAGAGVKALNFNFDGGATSIGEELSAEMEASRAETVFNLAGQRIAKVQKGINIVNGKKVIIK